MKWSGDAKRNQLGRCFVFMSEQSSQEEKVAEAPIAGIGTMVFGKWDATEVTCSDPGLAPYINLTTIGTPPL